MEGSMPLRGRAPVAIIGAALVPFFAPGRLRAEVRNPARDTVSLEVLRERSRGAGRYRTAPSLTPVPLVAVGLVPARRRS